MKADNKTSTPSYKWPTDKKSLNIASLTFYLWIKKFPILEQTIQEGRANGLATMKSELYELAKNGDIRAICWLLSRYDPELKNFPMNQKLQAEVKKLKAEAEKVKVETELLKAKIELQQTQLDAQNQFINDQFVFTLETEE